MADIFDSDKRSEVMSRIRGRDTWAERMVFYYLRQERVHFRKHYNSKELGINIDIALPSKRRAVFVDGDFWHGRDYEKRKNKLDDFWSQKITRNMERDTEQNKLLAEKGWKVLRVWESDVKRRLTREATLKKIEKFLRI